MPQRKLLVLLKERVLLLNSQIVDEISGEYPWLVKFLEENPNAKTSDLQSFNDEVRNFFTYRYNTIVTQAASEWTSHNGKPVDIKDKDEMFECELCHHKPIVYVCCIVNKLNGKELNVGTECVKHFGMTLGKDIRALFKDMKRFRRASRLDREFPGIERIISGWNEELEALPLLIPLKYEQPWIELGEKVRKLYMGYLEEDIDSTNENEYFEEIRQIFESKRTIFKEIKEYVENNKADKYIPGKDIINWIKRETRSKDVNLLEWLKTDGRIQWRTAFRIGEPNYLKSLIPDFNGHLKNIGCSIERLGNHKGNSGYTIIVKDKQITLFVKYGSFILEFGGLLFKEGLEKPLTLINLAPHSVVYGENSVDKTIAILEKQLDNLGYRVYKQDHEYNELLLHEKGTGLYLIENLEQFVEKFKLFALGLNTAGGEELEKHCSAFNNKKKYSKEDLDYLLSRR